MRIIRPRTGFLVSNLAIFQTKLAEDEFSSHPLSLSNYTLSLKSWCRLSINQTTRIEIEAEREESKLAQTTTNLRPQL